MSAQPLFAGRYHILSTLGSGAQGVAFRVRDNTNHREAVLKVGLSGLEQLDGTMQEFEALRRLTIRGVAPVIELGFATADPALLQATPELRNSDAPRPYLVRAWVEGTPLLAWRAKLSSHHDHQLARVIARLALVVEQLHLAGMVHGDLKPEHVLVVREDGRPEPVIIDFGLASHHTQNARGGTPGYLAPERLAGEPASFASDRFALGVVVAQALLGQRLPISPAVHTGSLPPALHPLQLNPALAGALARLLDTEPKRRPNPIELHSAVQAQDELPLLNSTPPLLPFVGRDRLNKLRALVQSSHDTRVTFVVGPRGSGRSRFLQHALWERQAARHPCVSISTTAASWERIHQLGHTLAALGGGTYDPPRPRGDRAAFVLDVAEALSHAMPDKVDIAWDDLGDSISGTSGEFEALVLSLSRAPKSVRLWATLTPEDHLHHARIADELECAVVHLEALRRSDLDALSLPPFSLHPARLDSLHAQSQGWPRRLQLELSRSGQESSDSHLDPTPLWLQAFVALQSTPWTPKRIGSKLSSLLPKANQTLSRAIERGTLVAVPGPEHAYVLAARLPDLSRLQTRDVSCLRAAIQLGAQSTALSDFLTSALDTSPRRQAEAWKGVRDDLQRPHQAARTTSLLALALCHAPTVELLEPFVDATLASNRIPQAIELLQDSPHDEPDWKQARLVTLARLSFSAGDLKACSDWLALLDDSLEPWQRAQVEHLRAQIQVRTGGSDARAHLNSAREALKRSEHPNTSALSAELHALEVAAAAYAGQSAPPAISIDRSALPPTVHVRVLSLEAMAAYVRGQWDKATSHYRAALEVTDRAGLAQQRPLVLLNLGTSHHRRGRLALGRDFYHQGIRASTPSTKASTRALLRANLANLDIKLGRLHEARALLNVATRIASTHQLNSVVRFISHLLADIDAAEGHESLALRVYARCAEEYRAAKDLRHAIELHLKAGLAAARAGQIETAKEHLAQAKPHLDEFADLRFEALVLDAELQLTLSGVEQLGGFDAYLRALEYGLDQNNELGVLGQSRGLLQALDALPQPDALVHQELRALTSRAWRRVALSLTPDLRQALAKHLRLPHLLAQTPAQASFEIPTAPHSSSELALSGPSLPGPAARPSLRSSHPDAELRRRMFRMMSLARRILRERDLDSLIPSALDIALELSQAERGFVLLQHERDFAVAFSRDLAGFAIPEAQLQVSQTVAREVAQTGRPLRSTQAALAPHILAAASVQNIGLTALLCVPLRDGERVLGCLYLDHHKDPNVFGEDTLAMMSAYADLVAIALVRARTLIALEQERDAHQKAREQVEALLRDKEALLQDLSARCEALEADLATRSQQGGLRFAYEHIVAVSPPMRHVLQQVDRLAPTNLTVVVCGETGTGKEVIARAIHDNSPRSTMPFVAVNCGALTETLLESELFGHKRGAFTGAQRDRVGLFASAHGGTLLLDEVGEMSLGMQVKLLRVLQESKVRPVGDNKSVSVDVRVLAATHRDLDAMVDAGLFRQDLYYRLATLVLRLPPLRQRPEDIPFLIRRFVDQVAREQHIKAPAVTGPFVELCLQSDWPGNVRQLQHVVRAAVVLHQGADLDAATLRTLLPPPPPSQQETTTTPPTTAPTTAGRPAKCSRAQVEAALRQSGGHRGQAARLLGVSTRTLTRYIRRFAL